jgi:hypothetical protein
MSQPRTGGEKQILSAFLDQQRDVVLWKLDGLTRRPAPPAHHPRRAVPAGSGQTPRCAEYYRLSEVFGRPTEPSSLAASDDVQLDLGDTTDNVLGY